MSRSIFTTILYVFMSFGLFAQSSWDIQFVQSSIDCESNQACYTLEVGNTSGLPWVLGDQNYRLFYDGDLTVINSVTSLLPTNYYGSAVIGQDLTISGLGQEQASPLDDIDDNLGFLDFSIVQTDKSNPNGAVQLTTTNFTPIVEVCVDLDPSVLADATNTTCVAFYHSRPSTAGTFTNQYTTISENNAPNSTVMSTGTNYDDLNYEDGVSACPGSLCSTGNTWDIRLVQESIDCDNNEVCYKLQVKNTSGADWTIGNQNYRLFFDGNLFDVTSVSSLLPNNFYGPAIINQNVEISNQNQELVSPLDDIDSNLGFLDFNITQIDKSDPSNAIQLNSDTYQDVSAICIALENMEDLDDTCISFYHSRPSTAGTFTTQYTTISENDAPNSTIMSAGINYDDLNEEDGTAACLDNICTNSSKWDIQLELASVNCETNQACYTLEIKNTNGDGWALGDQNYRLFFDGDLMDIVSVNSLLPISHYGSAIINQNEEISDQGQEQASPLDDIDANLGFLDFSITQIDKSNPTEAVQVVQDSFYNIANICVQLDANVLSQDNSCISLYHSRPNTAGTFTTQYTTISENNAPNSTIMSEGINYNDLNSEDGEIACLGGVCSEAEIDLALTIELVNPGLTYELGDLVEYKSCIVNEGDVTVDSVVITNILSENLMLSITDTNNWIVEDDYIITNVLIGPLAPGDTLCTYIILEVFDNNPAFSFSHSSEITGAKVDNGIYVDVDSTPTSDGFFDEDDEGIVTILVQTDCPTISLESSVAICSGESITLNPVLDSSVSGIYSWSPTIGVSNPTNQSVTVTPIETTIYTLTFSNANCSVSASTTVIIDTEAPTSLTLIEDLDLVCGEALPDPNLIQFEDDLNGIVDVVFSASNNNDDCHQEIQRTWEVSDACGNTNLYTQTLNIIDDSAPIITPVHPLMGSDFSSGDTIYMDCANLDLIQIEDFLIVDACDNLVNGEVVENGILYGECPDNDYLTFMNCYVEATDDCGNVSQYFMYIHISDMTAPVFSNIPANSTFECGAVIPAPITPTLSDSCNNTDELSVTFNEETINGNCAESYEIVRTWTATDPCGNISISTQTINVSDNIAPEFTNTPDNLTLSCGALVPDSPIPNVSDNCTSNENISLEINETAEVGDCIGSLIITRTWTATDNCGNASTVTQVITIIDEAAPFFINAPTDITVNCSEIPIAQTPNASDDCTQMMDIVMEMTESIVAGDCLGNYSLTRTWIATDNCGNASTATRVINVIDTVVPIFTFTPQDTLINESIGELVPTAILLTATDLCDNMVEVSYSELINQGVCERVITRTWTATDDCNNSVSVSQVITVQESCGCIMPEVEAILLNPSQCNESTGTASIELVGDESIFQFNWLPNIGTSTSSIDNERTNLPAGDYLVIVQYDNQEDCIEKIYITIEDDCTLPFNGAFTVLGYSCNYGPANYCLDIPYEEIDNYEVKIDDLLLNDELLACNSKLVHSYNFGDVEIANTITLESWTLNGQTLSGSFASIYELLTFLNNSDENGDWILDIHNGLISGGNASSTYGELVIQFNDGISMNCPLLEMVVDFGVEMRLPKEDLNQLSITNLLNGVETNIDLFANCVRRDSVYLTTETDALNSYCVSSGDLYSGIVNTELQRAGTNQLDLSAITANVSQACFTFSTLSEGSDQVTIVLFDKYDVSDTTDIFIETRNSQPIDELIIYSGISPNKDGVNDVFTIENIQQFPENKLLIYNRWGNRVYAKNGYSNDWGGTYEGVRLPEGTYFYVLELSPEDKRSGYLQIVY